MKVSRKFLKSPKWNSPFWDWKPSSTAGWQVTGFASSGAQPAETNELHAGGGRLPHAAWRRRYARATAPHGAGGPAWKPTWRRRGANWTTCSARSGQGLLTPATKALPECSVRWVAEIRSGAKGRRNPRLRLLYYVRCRRHRSFPQTRTTLAPSYGAIGTALQAGSALQLNPLFAFKSNQTACKEHGSLHGRLLRMQTLVPLRSHSIMGGTALGTAGRHGGATNFGCGFTTRTSRMVGLPSTRGWKHVEGASRHINRAKNSLD